MPLLFICRNALVPPFPAAGSVSNVTVAQAIKPMTAQASVLGQGVERETKPTNRIPLVDLQPFLVIGEFTAY